MTPPPKPTRPWLAWVALTAAPMGLVYAVFDQVTFLGDGRNRGQVIGRDFVSDWSAARLAHEGRIAEIFDPRAYGQALARLWGEGLAQQGFPYPPSLLPLIAWLEPLPYGLALALWSLAGVAALLAAAWPYSRRPAVAAMIVVAPAVLMCLDDGQNGLFTAALLVGGLRLADRRPWLAGALIGLATFKPQLGLLIPLALVCARRWRVVGAAAGSALALAVASWLVAGEAGWRLYLTRTLPFQGALLEHSPGVWRWLTPSPLVGGLTAGLPRPAAYGLQLAISLGVATVIAARFWRLGAPGRPIRALDILVLVIAGFLAAPYSFNYDMPSIALALVVAGCAEPALDAGPRWRAGSALLWVTPFLMMAQGLASSGLGLRWPSIGGLFLAVGLWLVWTAARLVSADAITPHVADAPAEAT